jgi:hypothetical protein
VGAGAGGCWSKVRAEWGYLYFGGASLDAVDMSRYTLVGCPVPVCFLSRLGRFIDALREVNIASRPLHFPDHHLRIF